MRVSLERLESHPLRPKQTPVYRLALERLGGNQPWKVTYLINQAEYDSLKESVMEADNDDSERNDQESK